MLDRREFLAVGASTLIGLNQRTGAMVLLTSPGNPIAKESMRGYQKCFNLEPVDTLPADAHLIIVPGFRALPAILRQAALGGASVVLETGLAFAEPEEVMRQRQDLWSNFGIAISPKLSRAANGSFRYIRYHWPTEALVRDYTESVIIHPSSGEPVASAGEHTLAIRKRIGRGQIIYLGAPLGPSLLAGDPHARIWIESILAR